MKVTVYTTIGRNLEPETEDIEKVVAILSGAIGESVEGCYKLLKEVLEDGKRLVLYYPGLGDFDTSPYDFLCEIPDGAVYVG